MWLARVRFVLVSTRLPFPTIDKLLTLSHKPVAKAACLNITQTIIVIGKIYNTMLIGFTE